MPPFDGNWAAVGAAAVLVLVAAAAWRLWNRGPPPGPSAAAAAADGSPELAVSDRDQMAVIRFLATYDLKEHGYFSDVALLRSFAGVDNPYFPALRAFTGQLLLACVAVAAHSVGTTCREPAPRVDGRYSRLRVLSPTVASAILIHCNVEVPPKATIERWADYVPALKQPGALSVSSGAGAGAGAGAGGGAPPAEAPESDPCARCGKAETSKRCPRCRTVRYCGMECARAHRAEHAAECRKLAPLGGGASGGAGLSAGAAAGPAVAAGPAAAAGPRRRNV